MTIYVVMFSDYGGGGVDGIYSTKERAIERMIKLVGKDSWYSGCYFIDVWEVDSDHELDSISYHDTTK